MKKTLVLGASLKTDRYSNYAIHSLVETNHEVVGIGLKEGFVNRVKIFKGKPLVDGIHTVTLYLNAKRQIEYYDYIIALQPERVVFNPGTKNKELEGLLKKNNIFFEEACTLVLLSTGQY